MWAEVNLNGVLGDLSNAINRFTAAVPAYVCPYCQGQNPDGCTTCKGRGVISKYMWSMVPQELREMRERSTRRSIQLCKADERTSKTSPADDGLDDVDDLSGDLHCEANDGVEDVVI
jgi:hypothetical protein